MKIYPVTLPVFCICFSLPLLSCGSDSKDSNKGGAVVSEPALPAELPELDFQPEPASENDMDAEQAAGTDGEDHMSELSRWRATLHDTFRGTCQGKGVAVPKALEQMLATAPTKLSNLFRITLGNLDRDVGHYRNMKSF